MPGDYDDDLDSWAEETYQFPPDFDEPEGKALATDPDDKEYGPAVQLTPEEESEELLHNLERYHLPALRELAWEGLRRAHRSTDLVMLYDRAQLVALIGELASEQRGRHETKLQRAADPWRMSHTELSLRLAVHLLREDIVTTDITIALSGREVTRYKRPLFAVETFFTRYGGGRVPGKSLDGPPPGGRRRPSKQAYGHWRITGSRHDIVLTRRAQEGSITAGIGPGARLVVHAAAGPTRNLKSRTEADILSRALGTALTRYKLQELDILVVALPRSPRMRLLVERARAEPRVVATGVSIALVSTVGDVDGLPFPTRIPPAVFDIDDGTSVT